MIPFTEYKRPHGTKIEQFYDPQDEELDQLAHELTEAGCIFEAELIPVTAMVHLECINYNVDEDDELFTLAGGISPNGPEIEEHIARLVRRAHERMFTNGS